jgi:hypothetical protein
MIDTYSKLISKLEKLYINGKIPWDEAVGEAGYNQVDVDDLPGDVKPFILTQFKNKLAKRFANYTDLTLQRYDIGQYILPHTDTQIDYLYVQVLTTAKNALDGLVLVEDNKCTFHPDIAGNIIQIQPGDLHWVNPVRDGVRWTAAIQQHAGGNEDEEETYYPDLSVTLGNITV